ncbi:MAG: AAA family ATPase [Anaerolineaceae bacterium]
MWNDQQKDALVAVSKWLKEFYGSRDPRRKNTFYLYGYAGTGKSTLARHFADNLDGSVCYAAFTGKAALVMRKNGCVGASTIHSLIYKPRVNKKTGEVTYHLNRESPLWNAKLLIVDECSMVSQELADDILTFNKPILVLGDPMQLPPIEGAGYFIVDKPDAMLTEIHRQTKDNPIIYLATQVREGNRPKLGDYGESRVIPSISRGDAKEADQILVGLNATRQGINSKMRDMLGYTSELPSPGERLICLKNDRDLAIYNGGMFTVREVNRTKPNNPFAFFGLDSDDEDREPITAKVHKSLFLDNVPTPHWKMLRRSQSFDYGYAITVHKSQGSQWDNVLTYGYEAFAFRENWNKWLYTAITRSAEKTTVVWK